MIAASLSATALAQLLAVEASALDRLVLLLHREQQALIEVDPDELEDLTPEKSRLLDEVGQAVWARDALLSAHGYPPGYAGMQAAREADSAVCRECDALLDQVARLVIDCQDLNRVNATILHQLAARTSSLVASLLGDNAPNTPYGNR